VAGVHDALRPPALIEPLAAQMSQARFRALNTSHFMAVQTPAIVEATILEFLTELGL
jgi:3-oxoadipate enol-lactonase